MMEALRVYLYGEFYRIAYHFNTLRVERQNTVIANLGKMR